MSFQNTMDLVFATPIVTADLRHLGLSGLLEEAILAAGEAPEAPGLGNSSRSGGWQTPKTLGSWGEAAQALAHHVFALADIHTDLKNVAAPWSLEGWGNVVLPGGFNEYHSHGAAFWSCVYYVRVDDGAGGELTLFDPRAPLLAAHGLKVKAAGVQGKALIKPYEGLLVMFPGWLAHSVQPWHGNGLRISAALNLFRRA
jgi:uncharacterized protein (TIGR02466 family)